MFLLRRGVPISGGRKEGNFYVVPSISDAKIEKELTNIAGNVIARFELFYKYLGKSDYAQGCASYSLSKLSRRGMDKGELKEFIHMCSYLQNKFGKHISVMEGKPGHYGDHNLYFHLGEYAPYDDQIQTRNPRYGKFYYPVACYRNGKLELWKTTGVDYGRDEFGYYSNYIYTKEV